jgi:hypothetical protein
VKFVTLADAELSTPDRVSAEDSCTFTYKRTDCRVEKLREDGGVRLGLFKKYKVCGFEPPADGTGSNF